jgi:hypothetical protein
MRLQAAALNLMWITALSALFSVPGHAADLMVRSPGAECGNLVSIVGELVAADQLAGSQADRMATLARFFAEDYPILYTDKFDHYLMRSLAGPEHEYYWTNNYKDIYLQAGKELKTKIKNIQINRERYESEITRMSDRAWTLITKDFTTVSEELVLKGYDISKEDYQVLRETVAAVQAMPEMNAAMKSLIGEIFFQSTDKYLDLVQMRTYSERAYKRNRWILTPFSHSAYCYFGTCTVYKFSKNKATKRAIKSAVEGGYAPKRGEIAFGVAENTKSSYSELRTRLQVLPNAQALEDYDGVIRYDHEFNKIFHELGLKGSVDYERFTNQRTWSMLAKNLGDAEQLSGANLSELKVKLNSVHLHIDAFDYSLKMQVLDVAQAQESLQSMRDSVVAKISTFEGEPSPTQRLYRKEMVALLERIDAGLSESIVMGEAIETWMTKLELAKNLIKTYTRGATDTDAVRELARNFGTLQKQLGIGTK